MFEALDIQDDIQVKYTGGTVLHGYLGEAMPSADSVKELVKRISYNYKMPYFTITPTFSICPKHGYLSGEHQYCPKCDAEIGYSEDEGDISGDREELDKVRVKRVVATEEIEDLERDLIQSIA